MLLPSPAVRLEVSNRQNEGPTLQPAKSREEQKLQVPWLFEFSACALRPYTGSSPCGDSGCFPQSTSWHLVCRISGSRNTFESSNHPRRSPTIRMSCAYFPVFGSPTATFEVIGNTGKLSSEKAGVGGSIPSLATIFNHLQTPLFLWSHYGHKIIGPLRLLIAALPPADARPSRGFCPWLCALIRDELRADIHGGRDARVPHLALHVLGVCASLDHPRCPRGPQAAPVHELKFRSSRCWLDVS